MKNSRTPLPNPRLTLARLVVGLLLAQVWVAAAWAGPATAGVVQVGGSDLTFELGATSATTVEKMRLTTTGRLGIGKTSPATQLDVAGTISATALVGNGSGLTNVVTPSTPVAFYVDKNNGTQTISQGTLGKITWSREIIDTHNYFASNRFTPKVAGTYLVTLNLRCLAQGSTENVCLAYIYKNGNYYQYVANGTWDDGANTNTTTLTVTALVVMNGSTDYLEAYGQVVNGGSKSGVFGYNSDGNAGTNFSGILIR